MTLEWAREGPNEYWRAEVALLPLHFRAEIVPNTYYGDAEEVGPWMLVVVCEVWDINAYDEQVGHDASPLPGFDADVEDPNGNEWIEALTMDIIVSLNMATHANVRRELANTEEDLKRLRAIERKMSRVTLTYDNGAKRVTVTPQLAQMVLAFKDRTATVPWRLEVEAPNLVACYNEINRVVGRIIFRPDLEDDYLRPGRLGLYPYEEEEGT